MIVLDEVAYEYPGFRLGPMTMTLASGARCALVGRNGTGKTTVLSVLAGQLTPGAGSATVAGLDVAASTWAVRERVSFVTDDLLCCPWMTVREHFRFLAPFHDGWSDAEAFGLATALELVLDQPMQQMSRGTKMKVALCSAWGQQATVLLLDEPTAGLDPLARIELLRQLTVQLADRPALTVVFATHILEDLDHLGLTDLLVMRGGQGQHIAMDGSSPHETPSEIARGVLMADLEVAR